jgi:hypothetical protein
MVDALCLWYLLMVHWLRLRYMVDAWFNLLVQVYSGISHSDSVTVVPSFYFYFRVAGRGKDRWL